MVFGGVLIATERGVAERGDNTASFCPFRQIFTAMLLFVLAWLDFETEETRAEAMKWAA